MEPQSKTTPSKPRPEEISPSLKGIKYVIFPSSRFSQIWDLVMICVVIYYALYVPFHLGISGGYLGLTSTAWLVFNVLVNAIFIVDTFLTFFRAYRDKNGYLIYSLQRIRQNYIRSGWFFINLLACIPGNLIIGIKFGEEFENYKSTGDPLSEEELDDALQTSVSLFFLLELFKLCRLARFKKLINQSQLISRLWEIINVETTLALKFMFLIALISHWIACLWGLIAFIEAGSYSEEHMTGTVNWIGNWYSGSYVEGGLDPIGRENYMDRYWLCLFWAIQSITSIGYGNIAPVTTAEFAYANFLMLACGIFWAYIIGALVEAVGSMGSLTKEYVSKMDEANQMVNDFTTSTLPTSISGTAIEFKTSKRVRRFITEQRDRATTKTMESQSAESLVEKYPTLSILSPELQKVCALHLAHSLIEPVPYLSSKYLSPDEQAEVAMKSVVLEFAAGETFAEHVQYGRGILIFRHGFGFSVRQLSDREFYWKRGVTDYPADVDEVLVEDGYHDDKKLVYHFLGFTKVFFIPRSVIIDVLAKNRRAWKECARWKYFQAAFILSMLEARKSNTNDP